MKPITQEMIEAGIAAHGSDGDRPLALKISDIYNAMETARERSKFLMKEAYPFKCGWNDLRKSCARMACTRDEACPS